MNAPPTKNAAAPELEVARDLVRRAFPLAPFFIAVSVLFWGVDGGLSSGFGIGLVVLNFLASAALLAVGASFAPAVLMAAALGGFILRLGLLLLAVNLVKDASWVELTPLLFTILVAHLGLLVWETKFVSLSLAYPGLKPTRGKV